MKAAYAALRRHAAGAWHFISIAGGRSVVASSLALPVMVLGALWLVTSSAYLLDLVYSHETGLSVHLAPSTQAGALTLDAKPAYSPAQVPGARR